MKTKTTAGFKAATLRGLRLYGIGRGITECIAYADARGYITHDEWTALGRPNVNDGETMRDACHRTVDAIRERLIIERAPVVI